MDERELAEMAVNEIGMKPGHAKKFIKGVLAKPEAVVSSGS